MNCFKLGPSLCGGSACVFENRIVRVWRSAGWVPATTLPDSSSCGDSLGYPAWAWVLREKGRIIRVW